MLPVVAGVSWRAGASSHDTLWPIRLEITWLCRFQLRVSCCLFRAISACGSCLPWIRSFPIVALCFHSKSKDPLCKLPMFVPSSSWSIDHRRSFKLRGRVWFRWVLRAVGHLLIWSAGVTACGSLPCCHFSTARVTHPPRRFCCAGECSPRPILCTFFVKFLTGRWRCEGRILN